MLGVIDSPGGSGKMIQSDKTALQLFITHQQLAEAVKPTVCNLNNAAARLLAGVNLQILLLQMAAFDMRYVTMLLN